MNPADPTITHSSQEPADQPANASEAALDAGLAAAFGNSQTGSHSPQDEQTNTLIAGKYTLVEVIGQGGMGSVWRAKQTEPVKRFVAVKLIKAGMDSRQVLARFDAERQALALMDHPNIARCSMGDCTNTAPTSSWS